MFDGRAEEDAPDVSAWERDPAVIQAMAAARRYWQARETGMPRSFHVLATAKGAFTQPGAVQTAVLYEISLLSHASPLNGLAVVQDGRLVRNLTLHADGVALRTLPDIDRDGRDELVIVLFYGGGGRIMESAVVMTFSPDGSSERFLGEGELYQNTCIGGGPGSTASRLSVAPGAEPVFYAERFEQTGCSEGDEGAHRQRLPWVRTGTREPVALEDTPAAPSEPLPLR